VGSNTRLVSEQAQVSVNDVEPVLKDIPFFSATTLNRSISSALKGFGLLAKQNSLPVNKYFPAARGL
jgi:hypothetical protein